MKEKTRVCHWHYHDGWRPSFGVTQDARIFDEDLKGWHCWVYPADDVGIEQWMKLNMSGKYECDFRFNSGDPMYTVLIKEDRDATVFKMRWM